MTIDSAEDFQMGRVVSRSFSVLTRNAMTFLALAGVMTAPGLLIGLYNSQNPAMVAAFRVTDPVQRLAAMWSQMGSGVLVGLVGVIFIFVLQAALVQGTIADLNGEKPNLGNCLSVGFRSFLPLIVIAVLGYFGFLLGLVLLVVPGIILLLMWSVVVPVKVVEKTGIFQSFGRSRELTKGHRWKLLGLSLLYFLIALGVGLVTALVFGVSLLRPGPASLGVPYLVVNWIVTIPLTALAAVGVASVYYELRLVKEGVGPAQLAAAFD